MQETTNWNNQEHTMTRNFIPLNNIIDVDSVDSSCSYDFVSKGIVPIMFLVNADIVNNNNMNYNFSMECCIFTSKNSRMKCFVSFEHNYDGMKEVGGFSDAC